MEGERQRVDRFLWHARLVRTRPLAARLAASGHVRVNGQRIAAPGRALKRGDVVTVGMLGGVRVLRVLAFSARRGGAETARGLYEDLSPPMPKLEIVAVPRSSAGRPNKRERRQLLRLKRGCGNDD